MTTFDRLRPAYAAFFAACLGMALIFGAVTLAGGTPVTPELYGPAVHSIPAMWWAASQASLSAMAMIGSAVGWPRATAAGSMGLAVLFLLFAAAAVSAGPTGTLLVAMALNTSPLCMVAGWFAWGARRGGR